MFQRACDGGYACTERECDGRIRGTTAIRDSGSRVPGVCDGRTFLIVDEMKDGPSTSMMLNFVSFSTLSMVVYIGRIVGTSCAA